MRISIALIVVAALTRLLPHPDNFAPIGAMGLFAAAYMGHRWAAFAVPFVALFVSDLILNNAIYSQYFDGFVFVTSWWIYAAFALVILLGLGLLHGQKISPLRVGGVSILGSLLFFTVTNLSVWLESGMYPRSSEGLLLCFTAALPFLDNTILGDLFFSTVLFGVYEWTKSRNWVAAPTA